MDDYQLLPVSDGLSEAKPDCTTKPARTTSKTLSWVAIFISMACLVFNLLTIRWKSTSLTPTFPSSTTFLTTRGMTRKDIDKLRRPSQFIGFELIHRNTTLQAEVQSFTNFPILMAQIDSSKPYQVTNPYKGVMTSIGTVYPELSDMIASTSVSTIVQFRALDYGMENCTLNINIPASGIAHPLVLPANGVEIYIVSSKMPLYGDSLSYSNRPHRKTLIGTPVLTLNSTWTYPFSCIMDDIYTFELACAAPQCSLRWTQDKEDNSSPAMTVTQSSTVI